MPPPQSDLIRHSPHSGSFEARIAPFEGFEQGQILPRGTAVILNGHLSIDPLLL
jgi:hypothetical protein